MRSRATFTAARSHGGASTTSPWPPAFPMTATGPTARPTTASSAPISPSRQRRPPSPGGRDVNRAPDLEDEGTSTLRDLLQYLQDEYRIGKRADLILGVQWLRRQDRNAETIHAPQFLLTDLGLDSQERGHDLLPY